MKIQPDLFLKIAACATVSLAMAFSELTFSRAHGGPIGNVCGGLQGSPCDAALFCDYPVAAKCGAADQTGTCSARPKMCTRIYLPVCGCDGKTYGNDCERKGAGVSRLHDGAC